MSHSSFSIPILYEDNHLIVVEKPVNVPSQEDRSGDLDMVNAVKNDLRIRYQKPGNVYLGLVHRLDRPVGGAMLFAKTSKAASRLSDAIRRRSIVKEYVAVVRGKPTKEQDRLIHYLWKDPSKHKVYAVRPNHKRAKEAILDYRWLGSIDGLSLLHVKLHTGRTHQIRVQLAQIGCPLYGDQKYGAKRNRPGEQLALWSTLLSFEHPTKREIIELRSFPPRQFPWLLWDEDTYMNL